MLKISIPYYSDSSVYFEIIRHFDWPVFLDSSYQESMPKNNLVRFDVLTARPFIKISMLEDRVHVHNVFLNTIEKKDADPFIILENLMSKYQLPKSELPFTGGALGYFSYDIKNKAQKENVIPGMQFGIYDWAFIIDHHTKKALIVSANFQDDTSDFIKDLSTSINKSLPSKDTFYLTNDIKSSMNKGMYKKKFDSVKNYLRMGDCYQVNISKKYRVESKGDPWILYKKFRNINKSPFMAYIKFDDITLLSGSPERFIKSDSNIVTTRPIKGTAARQSKKVDDDKKKEILQNSVKEKAENLMIVDLLRNDLGVNCKIGSIKVDELFTVESYPNVHHLVSSISGILKDKSSIYKLFRDAFPGGSITGAPKKRAMEIIDELENHARDLYCGSVVYFSFDGKLDSNIAIRSMIHKNNTLHFYSGGGLTIQSSMESEYQEIEDKVNNIKKTLLYFNEDE